MTLFRALVIASLLLGPSAAHAEILAMVPYETRPEESLRTLRLEAAALNQRDGVAIVDVDPESETFGKWLADFPLPEDLSAHHLFYHPSLTKVYVTGWTEKRQMHVMDLTRIPYRFKRVDIPECLRLDSIAFSGAGDRWFLTCAETPNIIVGDANTDQVTQVVDMSTVYGHGIAFHPGINRLIVTESFTRELRGELGEDILVFDPDTMTELSRHKIALKPSPSRSFPILIAFVPGADPPIAYVTTVAGGVDNHGSLWAASWNPNEETFQVQELFDFSQIEHKLVIAIGFNRAADRAFITTAHPGAFHIFDIGADPLKPTLVKTLPCAQGAHHMAFSPDGRYAFVENGIANAPGLDDGSITVIDLENERVAGTINTFKDQGLTLGDILLLPEWHGSVGR